MPDDCDWQCSECVTSVSVQVAGAVRVATPALEDGVVDRKDRGEASKQQVKALLHFPGLPTQKEVKGRCAVEKGSGRNCVDIAR